MAEEARVILVDSYDYKIQQGGQPCGCCGAAWRNTAPRKITADKGIHIIAGHVGSNERRMLTELSHITTRNGPLTVVVKHRGL